MVHLSPLAVHPKHNPVTTEPGGDMDWLEELAALVKSRQIDKGRLPLEILPLQLAKVGGFCR